MTAVQARVHFALKEELKLLKELIRDNTAPEYAFDPEYGDRKAKKADYDLVDIIPVSDPNAATMSQRVVQYQAVIQMAQMAPQIYDLPELHRAMLNVMGIKNAEKLVPVEEDYKPKDPVSENQAILKAKPVKAFMYQNHAAHIAVHQFMLQDPLIQQQIGQSPQAALIMQATMAHIAEHVGYQMRQNIEKQMGVAMPPEDEKLPPQLELALSTMMAQAAQQQLMQDQAQAAQAQAQQQAQDPLVQMQQQELQIKQQELQLKKAKLATEAAHKADQLNLEQQKISGNLQLDSMKVGSQIKYQQAQLAAQQEREGVRMGIDVAKSKVQQQADARRDALQHIANFKPEKPE
jgi:hypothetical protein